MTDAVSICNLALSHLGDDATVSSIDPPEGSAQAEHCAAFYPIARDALLESHPWNFALRRIAPALLEEQPSAQWGYAYALPSDAIQVFAIQDPNADSDVLTPRFGNSVFTSDQEFGTTSAAQDFEIESLADGTRVLYTNQVDALIRYTVPVTDTTRFSPLFRLALSYMLASFLAGPVLKGETGRTVSAQMLQQYRITVEPAMRSNARQRRSNQFRDQHVAPWMVNR